MRPDVKRTGGADAMSAAAAELLLAGIDLRGGNDMATQEPIRISVALEQEADPLLYDWLSQFSACAGKAVG